MAVILRIVLSNTALAMPVRVALHMTMRFVMPMTMMMAMAITMVMTARTTKVVMMVMSKRQKQENVESDASNCYNEHQPPVNGSRIDEPLYCFEDKATSDHTHDQDGYKRPHCFRSVIAERVC